MIFKISSFHYSKYQNKVYLYSRIFDISFLLSILILHILNITLYGIVMYVKDVLVTSKYNTIQQICDG